MSDYKKLLSMAFILALPAQPAWAAPFCVRSQALPAECLYFDAAQCRRRASELSGFCVANPAELVISSSLNDRYCLVGSNRYTQCLYADRTSCENDAVSANSVCIERPVADIQENPYLLDINRKY